MTWTYSASDIATSERDQIRTEIGDVDSQAPLLPDEAIDWAITQERNYWAASARCAEMVARLFLRKVDVKLGRALTVTYSKIAQQYFEMARRLRCKAMGTVVPYVGGMSITDKASITSNADLVAPAFTTTMMQNPWVGGYSTDSMPPVSEVDSEAQTEEF